MMMNITKYNAFKGSKHSIRNALGIPPIYGPKNGITFVTATIKA